MTRPIVRSLAIPFVLAALASPALATPAASAEPPIAGRFYREGMKAMYEIGLRVPLERAGTMHMLGCRVSRARATCRLAIRIHGFAGCRVRLALAHHRVGYPLASWHCPDGWRPQALRRTHLVRAQQLKAL